MQSDPREGWGREKNWGFSEGGDLPKVKDLISDKVRFKKTPSKPQRHLESFGPREAASHIWDTALLKTIRKCN